MVKIIQFALELYWNGAIDSDDLRVASGNRHSGWPKGESYVTQGTREASQGRGEASREVVGYGKRAR
jgi:hypothetical protein